MATTTSKRKKAVAATVAAAAILLAGTFAWTSISQQALNESAGIVNVGGRLHDDFNGENKDVYVENFTDPLNGGQPIYARVKLTEYMEVGQDAGSDEDLDGDGLEAIPVIDGTVRGETNTWKVHKPTGEADADGATCTVCDLGTTHTIHDHWKWTMGGETTYMPTFNKDKDSLEADINGTYDGIDKTDKIYYDDYVTYTSDKTAEGVVSEVPEADIETVDKPIYSVKGTEYYDDDTDTAQNDHKAETGVRVERDVVHTAKGTVNAAVITMAEWQNLGSPVGNYWVYDTDGWAYWAAPIMPGEATGLLLNSIEMTQNPGEKCYYAINVVGQFATVDDWSYFHPDDGTSTEPDVSDAAKALLEKASASVAKVTVTNNSQKTTIDVAAADEAGRTVNFSAATFIGTSETAEAGDSYTWEVYNADLEPVKSSITNGVLTVAADETNESLIVAARSKTYPGAVGLSSIAIKINKGDVTKLPITLSRADGCRYIKQGETTNITAVLPDGVSASDVTFTVEGEGISSRYEIAQNGDTATVTVDETIPVGTWITVKATSSKAEGSLELVIVTDNELQFYQAGGNTHISPSIGGSLKISAVYDESMTTAGMPLGGVFASEFIVYSTIPNVEVNLFSATGREPIVTLEEKTSADTRLENGRLYVGKDEQGVTLRLILADADLSSLGAPGISIVYVDGETTFTLEEPPEPSRLYISREGAKYYGTAETPYVVPDGTESLIFYHGNSTVSSIINDLYITPEVENGPEVVNLDGISGTTKEVTIPANAPKGTYTVTLKETGNTENDTFVFVIQ